MSEPTALSLIPPAVVLILAIMLRRPILALVLGAISGLLLLSPSEALNNFSAISLKVMQDETIGWLILVCGSFGALIADWPVSDIVGLWKYLAKHGCQLGGLSAPRFLRMVGKDTFIPTDDMVAALKAQKIIDKAPTSLKELAAVQAAFNQWQAQSGRPLCQLSVMLAHTVNH